jgi:hypothetical protein
MPIQFITPSIISSVANTQVTGTITASQIATVNANTITSGSIPLAQVPQLTTAKLPAGSVLQVATTITDGLITTTTQGAPSTITNGVQVFSLSFTPTSALSVILVQTSAITVSEVTNFADIPWLALWDGSTFIAASSGCANSNNYLNGYNVGCYSINFSYSAGSTSARTISVRAGMNGGSGTTYINGNAVSNYSGSSARVQMTVWEISA